jgi:EAL domain-containing protein (putative c-di-GMP-specific phosphodiesterase class I)
LLGAHDLRTSKQSVGTAGHGRDDADAATALATALRLALKRGEFGLRYQPVLDTRRRCVDGVEVLLRWRHPTLSQVPPDRFVPIADALGLLDAITLWSLGRASQELEPLLAGADRQRDGGGLGVHLNLSARQVRADFARELTPRLLALGAPRVTVEVTDAALLEDAPEVEEALALLRGAGISVAVDDFGTGYSSLAYLDRFPAVGALKIDRRFVAKIGRDGPGSAALVEAILAMAAALGLEAVAEGVETTAQLAWLAARGCPYLQGFLIAQPLTAGELAGFLDSFRFPEAVAIAAASAPEPAPAVESAVRDGMVGRPSIKVHNAGAELARAREELALAPARGRAPLAHGRGSPRSRLLQGPRRTLPGRQPSHGRVGRHRRSGGADRTRRCRPPPAGTRRPLRRGRGAHHGRRRAGTD